MLLGNTVEPIEDRPFTVIRSQGGTFPERKVLASMLLSEKKYFSKIANAN